MEVRSAAVPSNWCPAQQHPHRANSRCYGAFNAENNPDYLHLELLCWLIRLQMRVGPVCDKHNNPLDRFQADGCSLVTCDCLKQFSSSFYVQPACLRQTRLFFCFSGRCEWVWSVPTGPRRKAVRPRVRERPGIVPLLLPQRLQVAPGWAELWGWVTRGNGGQRLIHRALGCT